MIFSNSNRPPLGLIPKKLHDERVKVERFNEVCGAIARYYNAGLKVNIEWVEEYNELVECVGKHYIHIKQELDVEKIKETETICQPAVISSGQLIKNYVNALQAIYSHVGFKKDWVIAPIDDCTDKFWNTDGECVYYADSEAEFETKEGNFYSDDVYKQRFYNKWVYEGKDFTMIFCDPHVDGMKWFRIFDNTKRLS